MKKLHLRMSIVAFICWIVLLAGIFYIAHWYTSKSRIEHESEEYQALYTRSDTQSNQADVPQSENASANGEDSAQPSEVSALSPYIALLPTVPPIQDSFSQLLELNSDTIGYLSVGDIVSLPVVWRENDNSTYLDHNFSGEIAPEGALFLDGSNRITTDNCLMIYGHNMQSGTMFGQLHLFGSASTVRNCPLITFDTIYENGIYAPFAAFRVSADEDVRKFIMDESEFNAYVASMRSKSLFTVPLDVSYGDRLLLLVTCDYDTDNGRFILACRSLRSGENSESVAAVIKQAQDS